MRHDTPDFDDEKELQKWLKKEFESYGWRAHREVSPSGSDCRADLIVHHDNWGWIGIECKYMSSPRNGKKVGEAIEQIIWKYRSERYLLDEQIDLWAFCPYFEKHEVTGIMQAIRETLCHLGIAILYPSDRMKIDFAFSSSKTKILLGDEEGEEYGDIDRIREMVHKKMESFDPSPEETCQYNGSVHGCSAEAQGTVSVDNYEVKLCRYHINQFEREMAARESESDSHAGLPTF